MYTINIYILGKKYIYTHTLRKALWIFLHVLWEDTAVNVNAFVVDANIYSITVCTTDTRISHTPPYPHPEMDFTVCNTCSIKYWYTRDYRIADSFGPQFPAEIVTPLTIYIAIFSSFFLQTLHYWSRVFCFVFCFCLHVSLFPQSFKRCFFFCYCFLYMLIFSSTIFFMIIFGLLQAF